MHPEPVLQEEQTSLKIQQELEALGISWEVVKPYGVVGTIEGTMPGGTVALRADMDALPIQEVADVSYKSVNDGFMHACGHDAHIAMLLGAAKILSENRDKIRGRVKLIFQEAEEIGAGALLMLESGVLDDCKAVFGLHQSAEYQTGDFLLKSGDFTAANVIFKVKIKGKGAHGSKPHQSIDSVVAAAAVIQNLQTIVSREMDPAQAVVMTVGYISSQTCRCNIITEEVEFGGTIRFMDSDLKDKLEQAFHRIVKNTAEAFRAEAEVQYQNVCVPVYNDKHLTEFVKNVLISICGDDKVFSQTQMTAAEDFAFYQQQLPGVYYFMGAGNESCHFPLHSSSYDIEENALILGAASHCKIAVDYLEAVKE